jgi:hypothetical protein
MLKVASNSFDPFFLQRTEVSGTGYSPSNWAFQTRSYMSSWLRPWLHGLYASCERSKLIATVVMHSSFSSLSFEVSLCTPDTLLGVLEYVWPLFTTLL